MVFDFQSVQAKNQPFPVASQYILEIDASLIILVLHITVSCSHE